MTTCNDSFTDTCSNDGWALSDISYWDGGGCDSISMLDNYYGSCEAYRAFNGAVHPPHAIPGDKNNGVWIDGDQNGCKQVMSILFCTFLYPGYGNMLCLFFLTVILLILTDHHQPAEWQEVEKQ